MIVLQNQSYWMDGCVVIQTQLCDGIPQNIKFIGGTFRILLEFLICLTPGGQGVILCEEGVEHLIFLPLCSAFVIFSTSLIGSRSFKKKNLK